jgi:hypothetical protein
MPDILATVSYGGGVQSTAMLVLAAQGKLPIKTFLFANVGDDSESPYTTVYVNEIAVPYAEAHGIELHQLKRIKRDGSVETLYGRMTKPGSRAIPIPARGADTGAPGSRSCTADFKVEVIGKWLKAHGASEENPAVVAVGISSDEIHRINARKRQPYERLAYPLVGVLDGRFSAKAFERIPVPMSRLDCEALVAEQSLPGGPDGALAARLREVFTELAPVTQSDLLASGFSRLPRPDKSACFFCPFHRPREWLRMRRQSPDQFKRACGLEAVLIDRQVSRGRDPMYLTRFGKPLEEAVPDIRDPREIWEFEGFDDDAHCDNGFCMT